MRERFVPGVELLRSTSASPVELTGTADDLRGELVLENPTDERIIVRTATLTLDAGAGGDADVRAIVVPGRARRVRVRARLDGALGAGDHAGELHLAGRGYPVVVHVVEVARLEVQPAVLLVHAAPGGEVTKRVLVTNRGNVPVELRPPDSVTLEGEPVVETDELPRAAVLVRCSPPTTTVEPGARAVLEVQVTLPDELAPTRWRGVVPLATADLPLVVTVAEPRRKPQRRTTKKVNP